jgi:hypothetical protein
MHCSRTESIIRQERGSHEKKLTIFCLSNLLQRFIFMECDNRCRVLTSIANLAVTTRDQLLVKGDFYTSMLAGDWNGVADVVKLNVC